MGCPQFSAQAVRRYAGIAEDQAVTVEGPGQRVVGRFELETVAEQAVTVSRTESGLRAGRRATGSFKEIDVPISQDEVENQLTVLVLVGWETCALRAMGQRGAIAAIR